MYQTPPFVLSVEGLRQSFQQPCWRKFYVVGLPERVRGSVFTEWHENHLGRLNRHSAPVRILRIFESMHHSVRDDFESDDTEGYQRGAEDHRRSALFQRGHRD